MKLALFFTRNVSLKLWVDSGLFDREKLLYEEHLGRENLHKVYWLTYGKDDAVIAEKLKSENRLNRNIVVLPMPAFFRGWFGQLVYSLFMPFIHRSSIKNADILKTNQIDGSWSAVIAKLLYKKPLLVRTGYTLSIFAKNKARSRFKIRIIEFIEWLAYKCADKAVVASFHDSQYIHSKYGLSQKKINVIHNFINTEVFCPIDGKKYFNKMIFVGRLDPQKNLFNLLNALSETKLALDIYGDGPLKEQLARKAKNLGVSVDFMGVVANKDLPRVFNRYRYFILPSLYEGMPKSLLEAMSCGLICIGTDIDGINEIIDDDTNGYLAKTTDTESLAEAIDRAARLPGDSVAAKARQKIVSDFSIEKIVNEENKILEEL
ncbi:MAG: glycosyltransferase family 4 protein, partial [Sedimentisphaerales bacterium]|nr:glycosyltransferase family 4 protein [Sedimentisphaerales bacterium]